MQRNIMKGVLIMFFTWLFKFIADEWMVNRNPATNTVRTIGIFLDDLFTFGWLWKKN